MRTVLIIILFFFSFLLFGQNQLYKTVITDIVPSLVSDDHTSEGFMVTLSSGRIIHFFRLDPGLNGNHTGNSGKIVKRFTDDGGLSWSLPITVFEDTLDDRNVNGGLVGNDRIVMTFRRYDNLNQVHIDFNLIYSDDGGETWSQRQVLNTAGVCGDTHSLISVPGRGYMNVFSSSYYIEIRYSTDGIDWSNLSYAWDYRDDHQYKINESCFAYTKDGMMIGLLRNDTYATGGNYYQVESIDTGKTWTNPITTNIADSFFCPSPKIFYDETHDDLWAIATDRWGGGNYNVDNLKSAVWIYSNKVDDVFSKPTKWSLLKKMIRPFPNLFRFYGYVTYTKKTNGNYLIVFTESYKKNNNREAACFYQFEIKYIDTSNPVLSDVSICYKDSSTQLYASGNDVLWYSDTTFKNVVCTGNFYKPTVNDIGQYKYYATSKDLITGTESLMNIVNFTINEIPDAPLVSNATFCYGHLNTELTAQGNNIHWYSDVELTNLVYEGENFKPIVNQSGDYTFYAIQDQNSCRSLPINVVLTINPLPEITLNYDFVNIISGDSVKIEAYNELLYSWAPPVGLSDTVGPSVTAFPINSQTYIVTGVDVNGCVNTAYVAINVDSLVGVSEVNLMSVYNVFPNPSFGKFTIESSSIVTDIKFIIIIDSQGKIVLSKEIQSNADGSFKEEFDLSGFARGNYRILLKTDKDIFVKPLILSNKF